MSAEALLKHYERIADGPDAVGRLRRFILDLAVRGKLVAQDSADESIDCLNQRIVLYRERIVASGRHRQSVLRDSLSIDQYPFEIPHSWRWIRFSDLAAFSAGRTPARHDASLWNNGDHAWVSIGDMVDGQVLTSTKETVSAKAAFEVFSNDPVPAGTMIMSFKLTIGKIARLAIPAFHNEAIISIRPFVSELDTYLFKVLPRFARMGETKGAIKGATLNRDSISNILIPLPPLAEQHRIVVKVEELMALCDRLESAQAEREATRDRLAAASLARLNTPDPDPETFKAHASFAISTALPALTTRPDQIKQLRQAILNLAVRGKLVPQNPEDESAAELVTRIEINSKKPGRKENANQVVPITDSELDRVPFTLPRGWTWARFPELGVFGRGKSKHRPRNDSALYAGGTHFVIQTGDVARSAGVIRTYTGIYNDFGLAQSWKWPVGTLCITIAANIADSGILSFDACFPDSVVGFVPATVFDNARYFEYFIRTAKSNLLEFAPATAQKNINLEILSALLIPLPPIAEQNRIVAKVDELMQLCDQLEASLESGADTRRRLLDALLHEALAPAKEIEEAA